MQHLPLVGYAATIAVTLGKVVPTVFKRKQTATSLAFLSMAVGGLATTWTYMALYFQKSFTDSGNAVGPFLVKRAPMHASADLRSVHTTYSDSTCDAGGALHDFAVARRRFVVSRGVGLRLRRERAMVVVATALPVDGRTAYAPDGDGRSVRDQG